MSFKPPVVIVHVCFNPDVTPTLDRECKCKARVSMKTAREKVRSGEAVWVLRQNSRGFKVRDDRSIVSLHRKPKAEDLRARMPGARDIDRAYVQDHRATQEWIEEFNPAIWIRQISREVMG